jgi:GNAT superfamily N-acetyltransferase
MDFRRATPEDADALARIHHDAWSEAHAGLVPEEFLQSLAVACRRERFHESLAAGAEETYMMVRIGEAVGFLTIGDCRDPDLASGYTGEIWGIYLAPQVWRQGLGTYPVAQAESLLRAQGHWQATLLVLEANQHARCFCETMGFRKDGGVKVITFGTQMHAIRYRKSLVCDAKASGKAPAAQMEI